MAYVDFVEDFTQMQSDANRIIQKRVSMMLSGTMQVSVSELRTGRVSTTT